MTDLIRVTRAGPIATRVLNRPDQLNALTKPMWKGLGEAIDALSADVALEILLEGRIFDAAEAKEKRLVTRVVADAGVAAEAWATAQRIAGGAPRAAHWHKRFARRLADSRSLTDAECDECFDGFDTEDFRIGYAAFLAKRNPEFGRK